jgi:hypothetical protein
MYSHEVNKVVATDFPKRCGYSDRHFIPSEHGGSQRPTTDLNLTDAYSDNWSQAWGGQEEYANPYHPTANPKRPVNIASSKAKF